MLEGRRKRLKTPPLTNYRATKTWKRRSVEHVKPLDGIQLVQIQPGQRHSGQAGGRTPLTRARAPTVADADRASAADTPEGVLLRRRADCDVTVT